MTEAPDHQAQREKALDALIADLEEDRQRAQRRWEEIGMAVPAIIGVVIAVAVLVASGGVWR